MIIPIVICLVCWLAIRHQQKLYYYRSYITLYKNAIVLLRGEAQY